MPREFSRSDRVADAIQRELASLIQLEMRDPRIGMVNINSVDVSRDLAYAKVYVTFVDRPEQSLIDRRLTILNRASGYLRNLLGKTIQLRVTPDLQFHFDHSVDRGLHLSELIDRAVREDASHNTEEDNSSGNHGEQ